MENEKETWELVLVLVLSLSISALGKGKKRNKKKGGVGAELCVVVNQAKVCFFKENKKNVVHSMGLELVSTCDIDRDRNTRVARLGTGNRGHSALGKTL